MNIVAGYGNSGLAGTVLATENPFAASQLVTSARLNQLSAMAGLPPLPTVSFGGSVPPSLIGGYGSTLSNLFSFNYPTAQVGLQFDWNMKNRTAEATVQQTVITERRIQLERTRTEQAIEAQVRNAMQALQTAKQRIAAAEASARAAKEKLDSEVRLFQTGESTNFFVLTRQNEFADSLRRVVVANLDYNRAVARYEQALGATLETHNIDLR
jgi:HAE1 family hydrophobic/amphiphilic exporter-1